MRGGKTYNQGHKYPKTVTKHYMDDCGADAEAEAYAMAMASSAPPVEETVHPDIEELCREYRVFDDAKRKLHNLMKYRQETFPEDLGRLRDVLKGARNPNNALQPQLKLLENGTFVGKPWLPPDLAEIADRHNLDDKARTNLREAFNTRSSYSNINHEDDMMRLNQILTNHPAPSNKVNSGTLIQTIRNGSQLPDPVVENEEKGNYKGGGKGKGKNNWSDRRSRSRSWGRRR